MILLTGRAAACWAVSVSGAKQASGASFPMAYTIDKLPDEPVLVFNQDPVFDPNQSVPQTVADVAAALDAQPGPVFMIYNIGAMSIELDDLIQAASRAGRGAQGSSAVLHHPNVRENVYVVSHPVVRMAVKGLESATFGRARVILFATLDEALAYCRGKLAGAAF